jgi:hypothetical protein
MLKQVVSSHQNSSSLLMPLNCPYLHPSYAMCDRLQTVSSRSKWTKASLIFTVILSMSLVLSRLRIPSAKPLGQPRTSAPRSAHIWPSWRSTWLKPLALPNGPSSASMTASPRKTGTPSGWKKVDWHFDHARSRPKEPVHSKGTIYVTLRLTVGDISLTVDIQLYLQQKTVRKHNRARRRGRRLPFRTKLTIARRMLKAIAPLLPAGYQVYVVFDSWYTSARFIKWCRKQKWHVICRLKSNRNLDLTSVKLHHQRLRHGRYTHVRVRAADEERATTYQVRSLTGRLNQIYEPLRVCISQRHSSDKHPRYYDSTDTTLSPHDALAIYHHRWSCEVTNWYIGERLGWADCRLWRFESTDKFLMV